MARSLDTEAWAEEKQMEALREMTPERRLQLTFQLSAAAWTMARAAVDRMYPEETEDQRDLRFFSSLYGDDLARKVIARRQQVIGPRTGALMP